MAARHSLKSVLCVCLSTLHTVQGQYDPEEAKQFAALASVTYCSSLDSVMNWSCGTCKESKTPLVPGKIKIIEGGDKNATRIMVGKLRDQDGCLMSFRGSDNVENWVRDFQYWLVIPTTFEDCDGCKVSSGFYAIWKNVKDLALNALSEVGCAPTQNGKDNLIYVTGHSLGAALTHLAMFSLKNAGFKVAKTYSFEAPRIGNKAFSDNFADLFTRQFDVFRLTHYQDPVVHLPFENWGYVHVGTEVYYDQKGHFKVCNTTEDTSCADQFGNIVEMLLLHTGDHCGSPLVSTGNICSPICSPADVVEMVAPVVV